ncbi:hypothetical protein HRG_010741 [Hirsutella rhossiliensis]|uniref:Tat pathway signal sequence n=1 Tax=Hirsutella rhossiliensis TaxID=111463 RepID=A0A9P8MPY6_9HYPO|nr:uncharacterized protein HRG_10741 [Hirsutella rhossiliensis]KAH0958046.1 hypothetical protein HRG_10741 [Hirsutella rhossiliensis]
MYERVSQESESLDEEKQSTGLPETLGFLRGGTKPLRSAIEIEKYRFSGNLDFDANGTLFITEPPNAVNYVGEPSKEIDRAWRALLEVDGVDLIGAEASSVQGKTLKKDSGHYLVGIDGFHQIHCLNMIRRALRPDYYPMNDPEPVFKTHINHCVDYVRQALMCNIDVTPLLVTWNERMNRPMPNFQALHTCRNFAKVKSWMMKRNGLNHPLPFAPGRPRPAPG